MWCWVCDPAPVQVIYQTVLGGIFHHGPDQLTAVDQCDHHSPPRSQTLIPWRVSSWAGSVITALIERRGARLRGSVFKSIICSPNPAGSFASLSWAVSPLVTHPLPQAQVCVSFSQREQTCHANYFNFWCFSPSCLELLFIHILFNFFFFLALPPRACSDRTLTSVLFAYTSAFDLENLSLFCCFTFCNELQIICKRQLNVINVNEKLHTFFADLDNPGA